MKNLRKNRAIQKHSADFQFGKTGVIQNTVLLENRVSGGVPVLTYIIYIFLDLGFICLKFDAKLKNNQKKTKSFFCDNALFSLENCLI